MPVNIFGGGNNTPIFSQTVDLNDNKIVNLADPVDESDAANKKYVDSKFQSNESWLLEGNNVLVPGKIGTTNDTDFSIIINNINQINFLSSSLRLNNDTLFNNPTGSEVGDSDPDGEIDSNADTIRYFGIGSLGTSKEFQILLGNTSNYIAWQNLTGQSIRIVSNNGCFIKK